MSVTAILNGYKRPENLNEQLGALEGQSINPDETLLWYNTPEEGEVNYKIMEKIPTAMSNVNMGVWARFAFALMAKSEYVVIFDDDTIPGSKWIENCLDTMKTNEGLLGTVGLVWQNPYPSDNPFCSYYEYYERYGWVNPNETVKEVDLVGHSWFFKREWLSDFWRELPNPKYSICGEDMHFSYMLQKYKGIKTFVPPHPIDEKEKWGSIRGSEYGGDKNSMWETNQISKNGDRFKSLMNQYFIEQRNCGWNLINERV